MVISDHVRTANVGHWPYCSLPHFVSTSQCKLRMYDIIFIFSILVCSEIFKIIFTLLHFLKLMSRLCDVNAASRV